MLLEEKVRINKERLLAETPLVILLSIPYTLSRRAPHLVLSSSNSLASLTSEYRKISRIYKSLEKIYLNDVSILTKISSIINDSFLSRLIHEYVLVYLTRGASLEVLNSLASRVLEELRERISRKLSLLLQWIEVLVLTISLFSLVALIAGIGTTYVSFTLVLLSVIVFLSLASIPFTKLDYLDTYISMKINNVYHVLYFSSVLALAASLYIKVPGYVALVALMASLIAIARAFTELWRSLKLFSNVIYSLRVLAETLSISTTSKHVIKMLSRDERIPREIIRILRAGNSTVYEEKSSGGAHIVVLTAELIATIIRSGGTAVASIKLILNIVSDIYDVLKRIVTHAIIQLSLLLGSTVLLVSIAKRLALFLAGSRFPVGMALSQPDLAMIDNVAKIIALGIAISSMALSYVAFKKNIALNFVAPLALYATILLTT